MKRILFSLTTFVLLLTQQTVWAKVNIVATTEDMASVSREVGGERVKVTSLSRGSQDTHFIDPKPSMIMKLRRADLLILVGADIEIGWLPTLLRSARNGKVLPGEAGYLDASNSVEMLGKPKGKLDRSMGDVHAKGNPHYWLNPANMLKIAAAILSRLESIDPDGSSLYKSNFHAFQEKLNTKVSEWQNLMAPIMGTNAIEYHLSWDYFAEAFGLSIVGQVEPKPGIAPSAKHLAMLLNTIKSQNVRLLLVENFRESSSGKFLSDKTGIHVLSLPISVGGEKGIKTYFDLLDHIIGKITKTYGGAGK